MFNVENTEQKAALKDLLSLRLKSCAKCAINLSWNY